MKCFIKYGCLISSLGVNVNEHKTSLSNGFVGIKPITLKEKYNKPIYLSQIDGLTKNRYYELLNQAIKSITNIWSLNILASKKTLFIVSSTKGDLNNIETDSFSSTRETIYNYNKNKENLIIISNACISGLLAVNCAADYINNGYYNRVVIIGIDVISDFIINGFSSLFAMSDTYCKPFDKFRNGINIGEACGILLMTNQEENDILAEYVHGTVTNDANHISGPSKSGIGLSLAINKTLKHTSLKTTEIDFISAHGTGTQYNDAMETVAFKECGLNKIPTNSFKGYFGHTFGASGIIELICSIISLETNTVFKSIGYNESEEKDPLSIIKKTEKKIIKTVLKTASGFGGGNATVLIKKHTK